MPSAAPRRRGSRSTSSEAESLLFKTNNYGNVQGMSVDARGSTSYPPASRTPMSYRPSRTAASYHDIADDQRPSQLSRHNDRNDQRSDDRGYGGERRGYGGERDRENGGRDAYRERERDPRDSRGNRDERSHRSGEREHGRGGEYHGSRDQRDQRDPRDTRRRSRSRSPRRREDREREGHDRQKDPVPRGLPSRDREPVPARPGAREGHPDQGSPRVSEGRGQGGWSGERSVPAPREDRDRSVSAPLSTADDAADVDAAAMAAMMGFSGFDTTKAKHVQDDLAAVAIKQPRTHRQYMNRPGGFNRPLDKIK
ncbi:U4/U6.U5 tri-snRNP-associated protein 3, partial [Phenoliferia sp. Uapishka_3]